MWRNYSNGKFGFTIQYRIWLESQPKNFVPNDYQYNHYIKQTYEAFENRVGWRKNGWSVKYPKAFNLGINEARQGQFPSWIWIAEGSEGVGGKPDRDLGSRLKTMLDHIATCKMR